MINFYLQNATFHQNCGAQKSLLNQIIIFALFLANDMVNYQNYDKTLFHSEH